MLTVAVQQTDEMRRGLLTRMAQPAREGLTLWPGGSGLRRGQLSFAAGGPDFRIEGVPLSRDAALVDADVHWPPALGLAYTGNISDQGQTDGARTVLSASLRAHAI